MMMSGGLYNDEDMSGGQPNNFGCYEDAARSVEIVREENKDGQLGSFGFAIFREKPPRIGTVIPGGPADKANLKKGDLVLAVNGEDITQLSHKHVTNIIKSTKTQSVWLSVCESDDALPLNSTLGSSPQKSFFSSTPIITNRTTSSPTSSLKRINQLQMGGRAPHNGSAEMMLSMHQKGRGEALRQSPPGRKTTTEPDYVVLMPPESYTVTRMSTLVMYCGPVRIPVSWSNRGVSSLCIQECARQLLSKRKPVDFLKVQLEVSQNSLRISNLSGNILAKHRRSELYYCGSCTNDEQYFAIVSKSDADTSNGPVADLCHIFKLLPDSKLSTYVIDRSKSSREIRSGSPAIVKSCIEITDTIQSIFENDTQQQHRDKMELTMSSDNIEYGIVRGISTFQLAGSSGGMGLEQQSSPLLKRKKSNVIDLRARRGSPTRQHKRNRSISNPVDPSTLFAQRGLHPSSSAGYIPTNGGESVHIRMHSDGATTHVGSTPSVRSRSNLLHSSLPRETAKRISDCSFSSMSSDHSIDQRSSTSPSGSPLSSTLNKSQSPTPVPPPLPRDFSSPLRPRLPPPRKYSAQSRGGAISPCDTPMYGSKMQLRRQGSEGSIYDLTAVLQMSPYHHYGLSKGNGLSASVDSIVTITTLAEDDVDLVVGRVAGWCGSFDRLLTDPLGLQYFLQFLESEHSEENLLFWKDIEEYKKMPLESLAIASKKIFDEYLSDSAPRLINIDDIVKKSVKAKMDTPTSALFDETQKDIYHLMRMDCYPRFQKSSIIKESLLAEMEGRPLPIESTLTPTQNAQQATQQWGKKKLSLLDRLKGVSTKDTGNHPLVKPPPIEAPSNGTPPTQPSSSNSFNSFSSLSNSIVKGSERRRSKKEKKAEVKRQKSINSDISGGYHPEDNLTHLRAHKGNLFEVNLPNRVSKIIEAPPKASVREALGNVLRKYNYSLDVMEVRLTSTLQTISADSPASVLIGKHISIMKSKHTVTAIFPDLQEIVLLADGTRTVRDLFDYTLIDKHVAQPYSVYIDGARAPLELDMSSSVLDGHTVTVKYLPPLTPIGTTTSIPNSGSSTEGLEDLISEIARLSSDTLADQRIAQQEETRTKKSPKLFKKNKKVLSPKDPSTKFMRTKSGVTVSHTAPAPIPTARSLSPPPNLSGSLPPRSYFPPPPASDPPNLSHSILNRPYNNHYGQWIPQGANHHHHQRSGDAMSGVSIGSGSSVDSITHELATDRKAANKMQLNQWIMQSQTSMTSSYGGPNYFPTALGSTDTLDRSHPGANHTSSLSRHQAAMMNNYLKRGEQLDTVVTDAYNQRSSNFQTTEGMGNMGGNPRVPPSNYPWKTVHQKPRARHPSDQGSVVSDDGQHFSDCSSMVSNTSSAKGAASQRRPPPSPTTHVLVVEEQSSETYV